MAVVRLKEAIEYYTPRIDAGIAWLKSVRKGRWEKGIDLEKLRMTHGCKCICGQAFAKEAIDQCKIDGFDWAANLLTGGLYAATSEYGFFGGPFVVVRMPDGSEKDSWAVLGDLWANRIRAERKRLHRNRTTGK
jgi:hypothetical protein